MASSDTAVTAAVTSSSRRGRASGPDARLAMRPSHHTVGAMATTTRPATSSFLSTTAPTAAKAMAVLAQASRVRSQARPGSDSSGSSGGMAASLPDRRDQEDDGRQDRDAGDHDGQDLGQQ